MSPEPDDPRHQWVPIDGHPSVHNPHGYLHMEKSDSVKNEVKMEPLDYPQTSQAAAAQVQAHAAQAEQYRINAFTPEEREDYFAEQQELMDVSA